MSVDLPSIIGMVHLGPLPGSPEYGQLDSVISAALGDVRILIEAGFQGIIVENLGDAPFWADTVPPVTVAAMTRVITEISNHVEVPFGVNVLRNDGEAAISIAAVTGASMVRINVLTGTMFTDQGPIVGDAAKLIRLRNQMAPGVRILADVFVKHATPSPGLTVEQAAVDTWERGGADALVISGAGTGRPLDIGIAETVRKVVPEAPIVAGSGATHENLFELAPVIDAVIVGTAIKEGGSTTAPVDPQRAKDFVAAASRAGFL